jgi:hypothetical protein
MRTAKRLGHVLWLSVGDGLLLIIRLIELVIERLNAIDRDRFSRFILCLKLVGLPGVRPWRRVIVRIIDRGLLECKFSTAKTTKVAFAGIQLSAIMARVHIGLEFCRVHHPILTNDNRE